MQINSVSISQIVIPIPIQALKNIETPTTSVKSR